LKWAKGVSLAGHYSIQGKFLLSSYPSPVLMKYAKEYGWKMRTIDQAVSVNKGYSGKRKTEVLTANYPI
jgi:DNA adenine methylase